MPLEEFWFVFFVIICCHVTDLIKAASALKCTLAHFVQVDFSECVHNMLIENSDV